MLRPAPFPEEDANFNVGQTAAGRRVRLMDDERVPIRGLPPKEPSIAVWAAV
jgi:hypothetical protein